MSLLFTYLLYQSYSASIFVVVVVDVVVVVVVVAVVVFSPIFGGLQKNNDFTV